MPGTYWKLRTFKMAMLGHLSAAYDTVLAMAEKWRTTMVFAYLDMLATKAWLERLQYGATKNETRIELPVFERLGAKGKKELLVLQGFLEASVPTRDSLSVSAI